MCCAIRSRVSTKSLRVRVSMTLTLTGGRLLGYSATRLLGDSATRRLGDSAELLTLTEFGARFQRPDGNRPRSRPSASPYGFASASTRRARLHPREPWPQRWPNRILAAGRP